MRLEIWKFLFWILLTKINLSLGKCRPNWFDCDNGRCIAEIWKCDGDNDCSNAKDELGCEYPPINTKCSSSQFSCHSDKHCIPAKWQCDGETDCEDGSDEVQCDSSEDKCQGFRCRDHHCIPEKWRCDGNHDCSDSSDEESCSTDKPCTNSEFRCSSGVCISQNLTCNGNRDCSDGSDEGLLCGNTCENANCSQICMITPSGPQCLCENGYVPATEDNRMCLDVDECIQDGFCSQQCTNIPGSYKCSCQAGYELVNRTCKAAGEEPVLIFSTLTEIRGIHLRSNRYFPVRRVNTTTAVNVDPRSERVYWIEVSKSSVYSSRMDGRDYKPVISHGLQIPEGIAVDCISNNIYLTDSGLKQVLVCKLDGAMCHVLHNNLEKPRSIVLDPSDGFLYWSDWGDNMTGIYRSGMDGSHRIHFVSLRIKWPNGIAIDHTTNRLYWADARLNTIEYVSLDGNSRKKILDAVVFHPYSLAVFEDTLYWTDWYRYTLESCDKFTGHRMNLVVREDGRQLMGVHVYHPVLMAKVLNPCWTSNCSHMCVISPEFGFRCICPQGFDIGDDNRTCTTEKTCTLHEFKCEADEICIDELLRCDGKKDCNGGSDEKNCPIHKACQPTELLCQSSKRCISRQRVCDGVEDCTDGSDEENCEEQTALPSPIPGPTGDFQEPEEVQPERTKGTFPTIQKMLTKIKV